jgi:hypothetical protein
MGGLIAAFCHAPNASATAERTEIFGGEILEGATTRSGVNLLLTIDAHPAAHWFGHSSQLKARHEPVRQHRF